MFLGKVLAELTDDAIAGLFVFGLHTIGNTLVIPKYCSRQLLFYEINF